MSIDSFYQNLTGIYPKTSTPTTQDYIGKFMPVLKKDEDIICLTISGEFSSSIQSANIAKEILLEEFPNRKIHIEDSRQATVPQGLLMAQLLLMKETGVGFDLAVQYLMKNKGYAGVHFVVGDISYLQIGGRLASTLLKSGNALNLKPIVTLQDGKVKTKGVVRSKKMVYEKILDNVTNYFKLSGENPEHYMFATGYSDDMTRKDGEYLEKELQKNFSNITVIKMQRIGATIGSHTGAGTFGIAYAKKYEDS